MVSITGRVRSFLKFKKQNREEGETEYKQQAYQFTQGYKTTSTPPNPNLYHTHIIYIHTYIYELFYSTLINDILK